MYRLYARLTFPQYHTHELLDVAIPRYSKRGHSDQWIYESEELSTPLGLPLRIFAVIGCKDCIVVKTADTTLLNFMPAASGAGFELWLPTEECLYVYISQQLSEK